MGGDILDFSLLMSTRFCRAFFGEHGIVCSRLGIHSLLGTSRVHSDGYTGRLKRYSHVFFHSSIMQHIKAQYAANGARNNNLTWCGNYMMWLGDILSALTHSHKISKVLTKIKIEIFYMFSSIDAAK
jgi:hypothetical protein